MGKKRSRWACAAVGANEPGPRGRVVAACDRRDAPGDGRRFPPAPLWTRAVRVTEETGYPTLLVITSKAHPASMDLLRDLERIPEAQAAREGMLIVELPAEQFPEQLKSLKVDRAPAVAVYARRKEGGLQVWSEGRSMDTRFVLGWLDALSPSLGARSTAVAPAADPAAARAANRPRRRPRSGTGRRTARRHPGRAEHASGTADPAVRRTQYPTAQARPSMQGYSPLPGPTSRRPPPPVMYAPPPAPPSPVYTTPAPSPVMISPPAAPVVVQPQAMTIVVGAAPPPNIIMAPRRLPRRMSLTPAPPPRPRPRRQLTSSWPRHPPRPPPRPRLPPRPPHNRFTTPRPPPRRRRRHLPNRCITPRRRPRRRPLKRLP